MDEGESSLVMTFLESCLAQVECFDWSSALGMIRRFSNANHYALCKVMVSLVNCERSYYSMSYSSDRQVCLPSQSGLKDVANTNTSSYNSTPSSKDRLKS